MIRKTALSRRTLLNDFDDSYAAVLRLLRAEADRTARVQLIGLRQAARTASFRAAGAKKRGTPDALAWAGAIRDAHYLLDGARRWQAGLAGVRRRRDAERLGLVATCAKVLKAVAAEAADALPEARDCIRRHPVAWARQTLAAEAAARPKRG